jgi:hypothetical protein
MKASMYSALAPQVRLGDPVKEAPFAGHLQSPCRVVIEVVPDQRIGFDAEAMFAGSPAGPSTTRVTH